MADHQTSGQDSRTLILFVTENVPLTQEARRLMAIGMDTVMVDIRPVEGRPLESATAMLRAAATDMDTPEFRTVGIVVRGGEAAFLQGVKRLCDGERWIDVHALAARSKARLVEVTHAG